MIDWITQTSNPPEDRVLNQNLGRRARQPDTPRKQRSPKPFRSALGSARLQIRSRLGPLGQALLSRGETSALGMIDRPPSGQSSGSEPVGSASEISSQTRPTRPVRRPIWFFPDLHPLGLGPSTHDDVQGHKTPKGIKHLDPIDRRRNPPMPLFSGLAQVPSDPRAAPREALK